MTNEERQLLVALGDEIIELKQSRSDMVIGITAALLDLYRISIQKGEQTKDDAVARLTAQKEWLAKEVQGKVGAEFLEFLIATLVTGKLDAAAWLRQRPAGSA
jgi:hypothetical protein